MVLMQQLRAVREPRLCVYDLSPPPARSHMASVPPLYHFPTLPSEAMAYLQKRQTHYPYPTEVYTGSCHCKRVTFGVVGKPMAEERRGVCMCSCSICHGVCPLFASLIAVDPACDAPTFSRSRGGRS